MKKVQEMLKFMNQEDRRVGTCTVCRLYVQVDWGHKDLGFQVHPQQQVLEARVVSPVQSIKFFLFPGFSYTLPC